MKKILILMLLLSTFSYSQVLTLKVKKIAKKNIEIFINPKFDNSLSFKISVDETNLKEDPQGQAIADNISTALSHLGKDVVLEGNANIIKITIRWDAFNELKKLSGMIINPEGIVVGGIQYDGPYIPNNHNNIAKAIAYKLSIKID